MHVGVYSCRSNHFQGELKLFFTFGALHVGYQGLVYSSTYYGMIVLDYDADYDTYDNV